MSADESDFCELLISKIEANISSHTTDERIKILFNHIKKLPNEEPLKYYLLGRLINQLKLIGLKQPYINCIFKYEKINQMCDFKLYTFYWCLKRIFEVNSLDVLEQIFKDFPNMSFQLKGYAYLLLYHELMNKPTLKTNIVDLNVGDIDLIKDFLKIRTKKGLFEIDENEFLKTFKDKFNEFILKNCTTKSFNDYHEQVVLDIKKNYLNETREEEVRDEGEEVRQPQQTGQQGQPQQTGQQGQQPRRQPQSAPPPSLQQPPPSLSSLPPVSRRRQPVVFNPDEIQPDEIQPDEIQLG